MKKTNFGRIDNCSQFNQHFTSSFFSFSKKIIQTQTVSREKLLKTLLYKKSDCKTLLKLTSRVDMTILLWATFKPVNQIYVVLLQLTCQVEKIGIKLSLQKSHCIIMFMNIIIIMDKSRKKHNETIYIFFNVIKIYMLYSTSRLIGSRLIELDAYCEQIYYEQIWMAPLHLNTQIRLIN